MPGTVAPRFERVREAFEQQLADGKHIGAAFALYHNGELVADFWGGAVNEDTGAAWEQHSKAVVFSTTKGLAATCLHMLVDRGKLSYGDPVSKHWPEFARNGKQEITVYHVLTHQAGIPQQPEGLGIQAMLDWEAMVRGMEELAPLWKPGEMSGYHAINFGWLVGEIVRRVDGRTIGTFLRDEVAGPLGLRDLHIGLPAAEEPKVARLRPPPDQTESLPAEMRELLERWRDPATIPGKVVPPDLTDLTEFMNTPEAHRAEIPAAGGIATARDLARLYACLGNGGSLGGVTLMRPETIAAASTRQTFRPDAVLMVPVGWAMGYGTGGTPISVAGPRVTSYGHAGFGGSIGFADPEIGMAFGYVPNALVMDLIGDARAMELADTARTCAASQPAGLAR